MATYRMSDMKLTAILLILWCCLPVSAARVINWTDPVLTPTVTPIRSVHILELRTNANFLCNNYPWFGVSPAAWTDILTSNSTKPRAVHISELRQKITQLYNANAQPSPSWKFRIIQIP